MGKAEITVEAGYSIYELNLRQPASFVIDEVDISLRPATPVEIEQGFKSDVVFCIGRTGRTVNATVQSALTELAAGRFPSGTKDWPDFDRTYTAGSDFGNMIPPRWILPAGVKECFDSTSERISRAIRELVTLIRWRVSASRLYQPLGAVLTLHRWSLDQSTWHPLPIDTNARTVDTSLVRLDDKARADVQELVEQGASEPIAHALWREAWAILDKGPRSALVIGIAAVEVGFKELVADLVPDAEWLVQNTATPSLEKMLRDFLPRLPGRNTFGGRVLPPTEEALKLLKDAIFERNKTAHTGRAVTRDRVEGILVMLRDLLWLFDYYRGHAWALSYITPPPIAES